MRKLKLQIQVSVDGFIAGPAGEMDWITWNATDDFIEYVTELTDSCDFMLLGRKLAEGFIPYWTNITANPKILNIHLPEKWLIPQKLFLQKRCINQFGRIQKYPMVI